MITAILIGGVLLAASKKDETGSGSGGSSSNPYSDAQWRKYDSLFKKHAATFGIPWEWLKAIALNESSLGTHPSVALGLREPSNVNGSKSSDGLSWGLMQVTLNTARDMDPAATAPKLNDPDYSINLAARYLSKLKKYFAESDPRFVEWVIKSYNQGPGNSLKEKRGEVKGYAAEYWDRFQRNLQRVKEKP